MTGEVMLSSDHLSNDFHYSNQEPTSATRNVISKSGNLINGLKDWTKNQQVYFGLWMCALRNLGNSTSMNNENFG